MAQGRIGVLSSPKLLAVIERCASLPDVRAEVRKNHDDNLWWPRAVEDWRLRMLFAGWSTRISYNMISSYQRVVARANSLGYQALCMLSDAELQEVVGPLGLFGTRKEYLHSLHGFLEELQSRDVSPLDLGNDELISLIAAGVKGAGFKVAQCAVLYAKGYHCGVFPVDSGMKDMLGPCLGMHLPNTPAAHEVMRHAIEEILHLHSSELRRLVIETGYEDLSIPQDRAPLWWAHLVLIYFKRRYCNKKTPSNCPLLGLRTFGCEIGSMCDRVAPRKGGFPIIVLEGIDCVGKSTLAEDLRSLGYEIVHCEYNPHHVDIFAHYERLIRDAVVPTVFDRSFISEMAYGRAVRDGSRLSDAQFDALLALLAERGAALLLLREDQRVLLPRLSADSDDSHEHVSRCDRLTAEYNNCLETIRKYLPVYEIVPSQTPRANLLRHVVDSMSSWQ